MFQEVSTYTEPAPSEEDEIPVGETVDALRAQLEDVQRKLNAKTDSLNILEKAKNDNDWSLGEHKQWLADANERANQLNALCQEKEHAIQDLENRLREAEANTQEVIK
ncbi:unnamed protein product [Gongylonema pulchrum]|uniref:HOOK domain-containing protein n=1 Tax=Gongylonema pulchrum TaxID=637853 RepID=A0A183DEB9_9BILA|nr:unnamed protein product [Gongylonema pulchrum]